MRRATGYYHDEIATVATEESKKMDGKLDKVQPSVLSFIDRSRRKRTVSQQKLLLCEAHQCS